MYRDREGKGARNKIKTKRKVMLQIYVYALNCMQIIKTKHKTLF